MYQCFLPCSSSSSDPQFLGAFTLRRASIFDDNPSRQWRDMTVGIKASRSIGGFLILLALTSEIPRWRGAIAVSPEPRFGLLRRETPRLRQNKVCMCGKWWRRGSKRESGSGRPKTETTRISDRGDADEGDHVYGINRQSTTWASTGSKSAQGNGATATDYSTEGGGRNPSGEARRSVDPTSTTTCTIININRTSGTISTT